MQLITSLQEEIGRTIPSACLKLNATEDEVIAFCVAKHLKTILKETDLSDHAAIATHPAPGSPKHS